DSPEVKAWSEAQNALLERTLGELPARPAIATRLSELLEIGTLSLPTIRANQAGSFRYFYTRREGKQNQPVLYARDGLHGAEYAIVDPNASSSEGKLSLDWYEPCADGSLVAYGLSEGGSEDSTLGIRDLESGKDLDDVITRTRHASICWHPNGKRFYYSRYPAPGSVPTGEERYHRKLYEHELGRDPDLDPLLFAGAELTDFPGCTLSPNGRWLVIHVHQGWSKGELYLCDTEQSTRSFTRLTEGKEHLYSALVQDDALYIMSNEGAPRYQLYRARPERPLRAAWELCVPEHPEDVLVSFDVLREHIFLAYSHEAMSRLVVTDPSGARARELPLPSIGTSDGFSSHHLGNEVFFNFESFVSAPSIQRYGLDSASLDTWQAVKSPLDPAEFSVRAAKARSKDGTLVPYLMVERKDREPGPAPTLLTGYGGFNVSLRPRFSRSMQVLLEHGGVFVQANLRGGGELGEDWHRGGQLESKQNTFDDFLAVASKLLDDHVTSQETLAIMGGSNGGLLVAAAVTQKPELFRAAVCSVPLTDMLRYQHFLIGKLWIPEYGSPDDERAFQYLHAYSPYHHVREGTAYPAVLLTTALSDTRVDPLHARKMAALLQYQTCSDRPILLRTEVDAGHGAGTPVSKLVAELTDVYTFVLWQLGAL
ncbi:MAG TPA: prolyl oligopeptidase family serine peptidase, partial [Polyangiaceae bacterium]|nr:prolyl oligopeptidase family serine peptidase [Polyangiaceae bacterium]